MTLLSRFKDSLVNYLADLGWRHWTKLGVPGREVAAEEVNVDPEAMVLLCGFLGSFDLRLVDNVTGWLLTNEELIYKSRLKRILRVEHASTQDALYKMFDRIQAVTEDSRWDSLAEQSFDLKRELAEHGHEESSLTSFKASDSEYETIEASLENNRVRLRKLFGPSTRAEVLNFLLGGGDSSSQGIADFVHLSQSTVHGVLQDLVDLELVGKQGRTRNTRYWWNQDRFSLEGFLRPEKFFDWANYVRSLIRGWTELESLGEADTDYKARSALNQFNDVYWDSLSGWNLSFAEYTGQFPPPDLMEVQQPDEQVLEGIRELPERAMEETLARI